MPSLRFNHSSNWDTLKDSIIPVIGIDLKIHHSSNWNKLKDSTIPVIGIHLKIQPSSNWGNFKYPICYVYGWGGVYLIGV